MSWVEKIQTRMVITTGDGQTYTPNWLNAAKNVDYNIKEFNFPNVPGTLVDRREPRGAQYALELYFQGDDHLDVAAAFEISARDNRPWQITHPFYGRLTVQPVSLAFDNRKYNVSKVTGTVIETITTTNPSTSIGAEDRIEEGVEDTSEVVAVTYEGNEDPDAGDVNVMLQTTDQFNARTEPNIQDPDDGQSYFNAFNDAQSAIRVATSKAGAAMRSTQAFILRPAIFKQSVKSRLTMLGQSFDDLRVTFSGSLTDIPKSERLVFEAFGATLLSGMALATANPFDDTDYRNRTDVTDIIADILGRYGNYLEDLDRLQSGTGGNPEDFIPNAQSIIDLNALINFTAANLFNIGLEARQERSFELADNSDFVTLTHRLYEMDSDDENIDELMRNNPLGLNGILNIPKGTVIVYYI